MVSVGTVGVTRSLFDVQAVRHLKRPSSKCFRPRIDQSRFERKSQLYPQSFSLHLGVKMDIGKLLGQPDSDAGEHPAMVHRIQRQ